METSPNRQLIAVPAVGLLFGHDGKWAWRRARAGSFGQIITIAGDLYATRSGVEAYAGRPFSPAQLRAAGVPHTETTETVHGAT